jgi:hypothetical protein
MPTYWICARTNRGVPTDAGGDLGPPLWTREDEVELEHFGVTLADSPYLEVELAVGAHDEAEAKDRTYEWLAARCRTGTWLAQAGATVDFDSDDPDADYTEVTEMFTIVGTGRRD